MSGVNSFDFDTSFSPYDNFSKQKTQHFNDENEFDETDIDNIKAFLAKYSTSFTEKSKAIPKTSEISASFTFKMPAVSTVNMVSYKPDKEKSVQTEFSKMKLV